MNRRILLFAAALGLLVASPAWAYLDPASGSIVLQLLLGGIAGLGVAFRLLWTWLRRRVGGGSTAKPVPRPPNGT